MRYLQFTFRVRFFLLFFCSPTSPYIKRLEDFFCRKKKVLTNSPAKPSVNCSSLSTQHTMSWNRSTSLFLPGHDIQSMKDSTSSIIIHYSSFLFFCFSHSVSSNSPDLIFHRISGCSFCVLGVRSEQREEDFKIQFFIDDSSRRFFAMCQFIPLLAVHQSGKCVSQKLFV